MTVLNDRLPPGSAGGDPTAARPGGIGMFLAAALRNPAAVGAPAPSSAALGGLLASVVPTAGRPTVLELGAGTGAVSAQIVRRLPFDGTYLAVELDPVLADHLAAAHPGVHVLRGDVAGLDTLLAGAGVSPVSTVDAVVSGLPWSLFGEATQRRILHHVCRAMAPGSPRSPTGTPPRWPAPAGSAPCCTSTSTRSC